MKTEQETFPDHGIITLSTHSRHGWPHMFGGCNRWENRARKSEGSRGIKPFCKNPIILLPFLLWERGVALLEDEPSELKKETMRINGKIRL